MSQWGNNTRVETAEREVLFLPGCLLVDRCVFFAISFMPRVSKNKNNPPNFSRPDIRKQSCSKWTFEIIVPNFVWCEYRDVPLACRGVPGQSSKSLGAAAGPLRVRSRTVQAHRNLQNIDKILSKAHSEKQKNKQLHEQMEDQVPRLTCGLLPLKISSSCHLRSNIRRPLIVFGC